MIEKFVQILFNIINHGTMNLRSGLFFLTFFFAGFCFSQISEMTQNGNSLKMIYPSIYFKHRSTEYAAMPYTVDSCYEYIAAHIDDINDFVIWRDTLESEKLSRKRIRIIKSALNEFKGVGGIFISSMEDNQKISRATIESSNDSGKIEYLMTLNSVFEISQTTKAENNKVKSHLFYPRPWCIDCWRSGFHIKARQRLRKLEKRNKLKELESEKAVVESAELNEVEKQNNSNVKNKKVQKSNESEKSNIEVKKKKKVRRRLVWTGWKTGFRWSASGK